MENTMLNRHITLGLAALLVAAPLAAQQRGTVEFGGFVSHNTFDSDFDMKSAVGFGGRFGAYLHPRLSLEFEGNGGTAERPSGLADRSFAIIDGRLLLVPVRVGRASLLLGAGASHVDANVNNDFTDQSYGFHGLVGGKIALSEGTALRADYTRYFNGSAQHGVIKAGLSFSRHPFGKKTTVYREAAAAPQRPDSVSAAETNRLRAEEARYRALRDSLSRVGTAAPAAPVASSAAALATMQEMINFKRDEAQLSDTAKSILRDKVTVFRANPAMRIVITGFTSSPGTDAYNMALGLRRAEAAKAYLVSQGVDAVRIEIATKGEGQLLVEGPGASANAENRRGQFRLLIADPHLVAPKQ